MTENSRLKNQNSNVKSSGTSSSGKASSMAELMSRFSSKIQPLQKGAIVEGVVKKLSPKEITLDIGAKSDALVIEYDKKNVENLLSFLKIGDKVKASVISVESEEGFPVVSLRRMLEDMVYAKVEKFYREGQTLDVLVSEATRGGYFAETEQGLKGFLPNSQVLSDHNLSGQKVPVKIIEFDRVKKRIIFSQKATVYLSDMTKIQKLLKKGDVVEANVNHVSGHGLYVTLLVQGSQIEGFVHVSEVSYQRVEDLSRLYKEGDKITVQVLDIDSEGRRVSLSIKRLQEDSFGKAREKFTKDQTVQAVVKQIRSRGVTVELGSDILGFIPESKLNSETTYAVDQKVEAVVDGFDDRHRLVLLSPVLKAKPIVYR